MGLRRKVFRAITQWRDEREQKKAEAIRARMEAMEAQAATAHQQYAGPDVANRISALKRGATMQDFGI